MQDDRLFETLGESQRLGFLGAAPVESIVEHARQYVAALADLTVRRVVDLGAGGGVPGLVLAHDLPDVELLLVDRRAKRTDFLLRAVSRLGWTGRVSVVCGDAGALARDPALRGTFDVVAARGLGSPRVTAELARGFVVPGGHLVVSEPPAVAGADEWVRWPSGPLAQLGWERDRRSPGIARLRAMGSPASAIPRRRIPTTWDS